MKKLNNILKAFCLVLAVACMGFAFAGCGEEKTEGAIDINTYKAAYMSNSEKAVYSLDDSIKATKRFNENVEIVNSTKDDNQKKAAKRAANKESAKWGQLFYTDANLYENESDKPKTDNKTAVKIEKDFILNNANKFASSSYVVVAAAATKTDDNTIYAIHLNDSNDKYKNGKKSNGVADFIENAISSANYEVKIGGITITRPGGNFDDNVYLIQNKNEAENPNLRDILLGTSKLPQ